MKIIRSFSVLSGVLLSFLILNACQERETPGYRFVNEPATADPPSARPAPLQTAQKQIPVYIHTDSTPLFVAPDSTSSIRKYLHAFELIRVVDGPNPDFLQALSPESGFIPRSNTYTEDDMYRFARQEIDWYTELSLVCANKTPLIDLTANPEGAPAFGLERRWEDDGRHEVRYIRANRLDFFQKPGKNSPVIGSLTRNQRVIIDTRFRPASDWVMVVYPFSGYADKNSLYTNRHVCARMERQSLLVNRINEALGLEPLMAQTAIQEKPAESKPPPVQPVTPSRSRTIKRSPPVKPPDDAGGTRIITWEERRAQQAEAPQKEIAEVATEPEKTQEVAAEQVAEQIVVAETDLPELVVEEEPEPEIDRTTPISIVSPKLIPREIDAGEWLAEADLDKELFAGIDSVVMLSYPGDERSWRITGLGAFAPYHIPVEKNLVKLGIPYGGSVEAGKSNWPVSAGIGYNAMRAMTRSAVYIVDAKDISLYAKYTPFTLLREQLELFVNAGVTGWKVDIMNDKYPEHQEYYRPESATGIGYLGGAGAMYQFRQFLLGLQYQHYGTPLVILGPDLNEPETQEELDGFVPTTQYKLYAGSHQFQIILGYRIN